MSKHTLSVLVENKPGVLARIAGLFSRRGFNIDSLAVGPTEHPEVSRMTIVVNVEESPLEQVTKQLNKLVEVIKIVELDGPGSVNRELLLVKVRADATTRGAVLDAVQLFRAKVVDVEDLPLEQVTKQLNKLVEVIKIVELDSAASVSRELLLVKVKADADTRGRILDVVDLFQAKVVDVSPDTVVIQSMGNVDKLADLRRLLEPFGIRELVQSGMVAIGRGPRSISERTLRPVAVPTPSATA